MALARVDPHVKVLDESVKSLALARGLDALIYAPHFTPWPTVVDHARRYTDDDLLVVPAREIFTGPWNDRKHVLSLDLERPIPDFISLSDTMTELQAQEACVIAPHPGYLSMSLSPDDVVRYREHIDAIEVYNPKFLPWHGPRAKRLAQRLGAPIVTSSYAHLRSTVGTVWIEIDAEITHEPDVIEAIRDGAIKGYGHSGLGRLTRTKLGELSHLCWENSGQKLMRVLADGPPATHPSCDVYHGRFS